MTNDEKEFKARWKRVCQNLYYAIQLYKNALSGVDIKILEEIDNPIPIEDMEAIKKEAGIKFSEDKREAIRSIQVELGHLKMLNPNLSPELLLQKLLGYFPSNN